MRSSRLFTKTLLCILTAVCLTSFSGCKKNVETGTLPTENTGSVTPGLPDGASTGSDGLQSPEGGQTPEPTRATLPTPTPYQGGQTQQGGTTTPTGISASTLTTTSAPTTSEGWQVPTDAPDATQAPTEALTPTDAPDATQVPTNAPTPTDAMTPTAEPSDAPTLTEAPTTAPTPTKAPTATPAPTPTESANRGTLEDLLKTVTFTGASFAAIDGNTGKLLYSCNGDVMRRPASLTKMMTAIIAYENMALDTPISVTEESLRWHDILDDDGNLIYRGLDNEMYTEDAIVGTTYTLENWLKLLMLHSDATAADTIAIGVAGSYEAFSALMNQKAESLGMTNTYFDNPVGADFWINEETGEYDYNFDLHTTAEDFAKLTRAYMENDYLAQIAGTVSYMLPKSLDGSITKERKLTNYNRLLDTEKNPKFKSDYFTVIGTKTGYTDEAGRTLAVTAVDKKGHKVCLVYMSNTLDRTQNYYSQSYEILEYIFKYNFR